MIIADLDGTFCDNNHRLVLLPENMRKITQMDWRKFNKACSDDKPIMQMIYIYESLRIMLVDQPKYVVTSRDEGCRVETTKWLFRHGIEYDELHMRPEGVYKSATAYKRHIFGVLGLGKKDIILEDDPAIIEMARNEFGCICIWSNTKCSSL